MPAHVRFKAMGQHAQKDMPLTWFSAWTKTGRISSSVLMVRKARSTRERDLQAATAPSAATLSAGWLARMALCCQA
ncbi:MAG: hypothetical protein OXC82_07705 [Rhodobacteraceae bacterium]|nr:hypothetical protein [Paracoccaceae bacterium]MCY4250300.1 hypothetical protein [Paracoccaceae bacterium]